MFDNDYPSEDSQDTEDAEETRSIIPSFSVDLMSQLEWVGPVYDEDQDRCLFKAHLISPYSGEPVVIDINDQSHHNLFSEFTNSCAPYYHDYKTELGQDGSVYMVHVLPVGIKKVRQAATKE